MSVIDWIQSATWIPSVAFVLMQSVVAVLAFQILRVHVRFHRKWESIDKRLSEVLWRTRTSDAEELRKRTIVLEGRLDDSLDHVRTFASALDTQLETLRSEMKSQLSKIDRSDAKTLSHSRMVIYQLERIRKQLKEVEDLDVHRPRVATSTGGGGLRPSSSASAQSGAYRLEALLEPLRQAPQPASKAKPDDSDPSMEELMQDLNWEKKSP